MTAVGVVTEARDCDAAVIGGGPAGSTAAALLAFKGLYCFLSLADPWVALRAWRRRRSSLRDTANAGA